MSLPDYITLVCVEKLFIFDTAMIYKRKISANVFSHLAVQDRTLSNFFFDHSILSRHSVDPSWTPNVKTMHSLIIDSISKQILSVNINHLQIKETWPNSNYIVLTAPENCTVLIIISRRWLSVKDWWRTANLVWHILVLIARFSSLWQNQHLQIPIRPG